LFRTKKLTLAEAADDADDRPCFFSSSFSGDIVIAVYYC
jgi:hypothetical protein